MSGESQAVECSSTSAENPASTSGRTHRQGGASGLGGRLGQGGGAGQQVHDLENNVHPEGGRATGSESEGQGQEQAAEASQESSGVEWEREFAKRDKRNTRRAKKRRRDNKDSDDDEEGFVYARVPVNLLQLLSLLAVSLQLSVRQQLTFVMAVYVLCGEKTLTLVC